MTTRTEAIKRDMELIKEKQLPIMLTYKPPPDEKVNFFRTKIIGAISNQVYTIHMYLPQDYPYSMPVVFVADPKVKFASSNHQTHYYNNGKCCLMHDSKWTPETTIIEVWEQTVMWIQGYEAYWASGGKFWGGKEHH